MERKLERLGNAFYVAFPVRLLLSGTVQAVQNYACRIVSGARKYNHVTPILKQPYWLPVRQHLYYYIDAILYTYQC